MGFRVLGFLGVLGFGCLRVLELGFRDVLCGFRVLNFGCG